MFVSSRALLPRRLHLAFTRACLCANFCLNQDGRTNPAVRGARGFFHCLKRSWFGLGTGVHRPGCNAPGGRAIPDDFGEPAGRSPSGLLSCVGPSPTGSAVSSRVLTSVLRSSVSTAFVLTSSSSSFNFTESPFGRFLGGLGRGSLAGPGSSKPLLLAHSPHWHGSGMAKIGV